MDTRAESLGFPLYRCHKTVRAAKIERIYDNRLHFAGGKSWVMPEGWDEKHVPQEGGYLVVYEEGHSAYCPTVPFEAGYSPIGGEGLASAEVENHG